MNESLFVYRRVKAFEVQLFCIVCFHKLETVSLVQSGGVLSKTFFTILNFMSLFVEASTIHALQIESVKP